MILVDTSIWINLLSKKPRHILSDEQLAKVATCPPVIQEILQGVRDDLAHRRLQGSLLALPVLGNPLSLELYLQAAEIFRQGQLKGLTIRSGVDCLIAAIAIAHRISIWHIDRDFDKIAKFTALKVTSRI